MQAQADLLEAFELHSPEKIRVALAAGVSPTALIDGKRPIDILIEMYLRSSRFPTCLRLMFEAGATLEPPLLKAVLMDDVDALRSLIEGGVDPASKLSLPACFTSCKGVTALHVCAEYNSLRCARLLIAAGADVNARADVDADGLGGQTPLFHAVNSILNYCRPAMELLADAGADLDIRLKGVVWGDACDWETVVFDVTPISYAQCGLYKQFHRAEADVYSNIGYLQRRRYGAEVATRNLPNRYLQG
jgi:ankyrin repeat protein